MKTFLAIAAFIVSVPLAYFVHMTADYMIPYEKDPIDTPSEYLEVCNYYDTIPQIEQFKLIKDIPTKFHDTLMFMKCYIQYVSDTMAVDTVTNQKPIEND